jgi:(p)ppGpp synthase/HD superfamily hydrolase
MPEDVPRATADEERELVVLADRIASLAHDGQIDKAGLPYIGHPRRVAARLTSGEEKAAALLHDVLEDTDLSVQDLLASGVPTSVVDAVIVLTKQPGEKHTEAVRRAARHPIARAVKAADIADNADPERLALLPADLQHRLRQKYADALEILKNESAGLPPRVADVHYPEHDMSDGELSATFDDVFGSMPERRQGRDHGSFG